MHEFKDDWTLTPLYTFVVFAVGVCVGGAGVVLFALFGGI